MTTAEAALKPCPFCGNPAIYWKNRERVTTLVCCPDEVCPGNDVGAKADMWNRRAILMDAEAVREVCANLVDEAAMKYWDEHGGTDRKGYDALCLLYEAILALDLSAFTMDERSEFAKWWATQNMPSAEALRLASWNGWLARSKLADEPSVCDDCGAQYGHLPTCTKQSKSQLKRQAEQAHEAFPVLSGVMADAAKRVFFGKGPDGAGGTRDAATAAPKVTTEDSDAAKAESSGARSLRHQTPETDAFVKYCETQEMDIWASLVEIQEYARSLERRLRKYEK